jgi:hypothetical protein
VVAAGLTSQLAWTSLPEQAAGNKKPAISGILLQLKLIVDISADYLFMTYIVTSKPKRISVAAGLVHMMISFWLLSASQ